MNLSGTQFLQCPTQLRNERGEDQPICSLALPGGYFMSCPWQDSIPKLSLAKLWQSRKILLCSLVVRHATRIANPRVGWIPCAEKLLVVVASLGEPWLALLRFPVGLPERWRYAGSRYRRHWPSIRGKQPWTER